MISSHLTKVTWLHLIPTSIKLTLLSFITVASSFITSVAHILILLIISILIFASLGEQSHEKLKSLIKNFGTFILCIGILQSFFIPINLAALTSIKMLLLILLADLVSITTPLSELKRIILKLLVPFGFFGVNVNKISLMMTLSLRLIHVYIALWKKLDISLQSRMIRKKSVTKPKMHNFKVKKLMTPFLYNAHHLTLNMADALQARSKNKR